MKDINKKMDSLPRCKNTEQWKVNTMHQTCVWTLPIIYRFKHVSGTDIPTKYATKLLTSIKPAIKKWVKIGLSKYQKGHPGKQTKNSQGR